MQLVIGVVLRTLVSRELIAGKARFSVERQTERQCYSYKKKEDSNRKRRIQMQNFSEATLRSKTSNNNHKSENGLQQLAEYYQSLFDIEENFNYYSKNEYQNAKRKYVKYLMDNRVL